MIPKSKSYPSPKMGATSLSSGWYGFDLDGTLAVHRAGEWKGPEHIGVPIPKMLAKLKEHLANGDEVRIFTARVWRPLPYECSSTEQWESLQRDAARAQEAIEKWCIEHVGVKLRVTNIKDYQMIALYDDRARQVVPNSGELLEELLIKATESYFALASVTKDFSAKA